MISINKSLLNSTIIIITIINPSLQIQWRLLEVGAHVATPRDKATPKKLGLFYIKHAREGTAISIISSFSDRNFFQLGLSLGVNTQGLLRSG